MVPRILRATATLLVLVLITAACGQKEGVHVGFAGGAGAGGTPVAGGGVDTDGDGVADQAGVDADGDGVADPGSVAMGDTGTSTADTSATSAGGTSSSSSSTGSTASTPNDQSGGGGQAPQGDAGGGQSPQQEDQTPAGPGDSTGITADTITLGIHAPLTGAAPIPQRSFEAGKDQYWRNVEIEGRKVKVVFRDDKYNPSAASQGCQELILKEKVFILGGSGGTDQIAECARIAARYGVPYLSAGVTRVGLDRLPNYWAQSMSYSDQMPLLMQWIKKNAAPSNGKVGIIASNTANFDDAVAAFTEQAKKHGFTPVVYRPSKAPSDGELAGVGQKMVTDGVTVGTPVMQPTAWIKMAKNPQLNNVQWAGIGVTMGLNSVASVVCPEAAGAMFFSPFPGFNLAKRMDPKFPGQDDIQWAQWGSNKSLHAIFTKMNGNLTREAFNKAMIGKIETGLFPPTNHTAQNHFAVDSVHVLNLDCGARQFVSTQSDLFRKGF